MSLCGAEGKFMQAVQPGIAGPLREAIASIVTNAGAVGKKERIKK
jgi:hypothetical protein